MLEADLVHDNDGGFLVVFSSANVGDAIDLYAQHFDADGAPVGSAIMVNEQTDEKQHSAAIARQGGGFIVVWETIEEQPPLMSESSLGVSGRRLDTDGNPLGAEFTVNGVDFANDVPAGPRVRSNLLGEFLVVWKQLPAGATEGSTHLVGRRFDASAVALGSPFVVIDALGGAAGLAGSPSGEMLATLFDWDRRGTFGRRILPDGTFDGDPFRLDHHLESADYGFAFPAASAIDDAGDFLAVWRTLFPLPGFSHQTDVFARRFCDATSPTCDRCAGFDDSIDDDGDGVPNGCDICTNVAGDRDIAHPSRLQLRSIETSSNPSKANKLRFNGEMVLPGAPGVFASLSLDVQGGEVRVRTDDSGVIAEAQLVSGIYAGAGTAGWTLNGSGKTWTYRDDRAARIDGISRVRVKDASSKQPNLVRVKIAGAGVPYFTRSVSLPYEVAVALGDQSVANTCGETSFASSDCIARSAAEGTIFGSARCAE